jgi:hypothetical protein
MVSSVSLSKESKEDNGNHEVDGEVPVKTAIKNAIDSLRIYKDPLSPADKVMVMQGWNKVFQNSLLGSPVDLLEDLGGKQNGLKWCGRQRCTVCRAQQRSTRTVYDGSQLGSRRHADGTA